MWLTEKRKVVALLASAPRADFIDFYRLRAFVLTLQASGDKIFVIKHYVTRSSGCGPLYPHERPLTIPTPTKNKESVVELPLVSNYTSAYVTLLSGSNVINNSYILLLVELQMIEIYSQITTSALLI